MSRPIKFEAYDTERNEMLTWEEINRLDTMGSLCFLDILRLDVRFKLRQYTGLQDRNGKEIYEGDIVTARERSDMAPFTGYVHYLNAQYWVNYIGYESYYLPLIQLHGAVYKPIEVIGNIYKAQEWPCTCGDCDGEHHGFAKGLPKAIKTAE